MNVQGWYWPSYGPQVTYYIPGPLLNPGKNELIMLELEETPKTPKGVASHPMPYSVKGVGSHAMPFPRSLLTET